MTGLADYLLGYLITADNGQKRRYGPQPFEGIVSVVCQAFECPPSVAKQQEWPLVRAVLDYRNAEAAVELMKKGKEGVEELGKQPALTDILLRMQRARAEDDVPMREVEVVDNTPLLLAPGG